MLLFTNDDMRSLLASSLKTATLDQSGWRDSGQGPGSTEGSYINWLTVSDNVKGVVGRATHHVGPSRPGTQQFSVSMRA